ncbi:MAG: fibrobacter succinogenes major paralogous domain-containing protein [Fibromonadaceae bacterium]|nr:fibrobacter succinogenes major paralogous domain-containing protein [Fibromonadaceae bacterium]
MRTNNITAILAILSIMVLTNCSSDSGDDTTSVNPSSGGFVDGTTRKHYGKDKPQFCDERDGHKYVYVTTGEGTTAQTWMAENLNYEAEGSKCYDDDDENCEKYGRLYDWNTAMKSCPEGWHLPSRDEWDILRTVIGGREIAGKLKTASGWNDGYKGKSSNGEDAYGFSALPGGRGYSDGRFGFVGNYSEWWIGKHHKNSSDNAYYLFVSYRSEYTYYGLSGKSVFLSVRCVRD